MAFPPFLPLHHCLAPPKACMRSSSWDLMWARTVPTAYSAWRSRGSQQKMEWLVCGPLFCRQDCTSGLCCAAACFSWATEHAYANIWQLCVALYHGQQNFCCGFFAPVCQVHVMDHWKCMCELSAGVRQGLSWAANNACANVLQLCVKLFL